METKRKDGIELLRIISMIMIVAFHYKIHMNYDTAMNGSLSLKQLFLIIFGNYGVLGSNAFFVISSYFLINRKSINIRRVVDVVIKVSCVSVIMYILACYGGGIEFKIKKLLEALGGVFTYQYWFISVWVIITLIFPFFNYIINHTKKPYYIFLLVVLYIFLFIYPSFKGYDLAGRLGEAIWIYLLVGLLELRCEKNIFEKHAGLFLFLMIAIDIVYQLIVKILGLSSYIYLFQSGTSTVYSLGAVFIFYLFRNIEIRNHKLKNIIHFGGRYSVGAFLCCFPAVVPRSFMYDSILKGDFLWNITRFRYFVIIFIVEVIGVVVVGILLDWIYECVIGKQTRRIIAKIPSQYNIIRED